jgi:hypothetical protein
MDFCVCVGRLRRLALDEEARSLTHAPLNDHQKREAIKRRDYGEETLRSIGRSYNVSAATISRLVMTIDLNVLGTIVSIVSLVLAVVFWWLASKQAQKADATLNEVKDKMMSWQNDINSAAINLIQARPEVIAQKVALEEAKSQSAFTDRLAGVIESLVREADENSAGHKIILLKELLDHQRQYVLGSEQIKANCAAKQQSNRHVP